MSEIQTEEGYFSARDGVRLFWHTAKVSAPVAHVAHIHGFFEHHGRHMGIAKALNDAGYTVHMLDCRGHGQSGGKRAHVDKFGDFVSDLELFVARVKEQARDLPVFIVSHSHGGLITARFLLDRPEAVRGVVFSSPYFRRKAYISPLKLLAGKVIGRVLPGLPMKNELVPEQLTRDVAIQQATKNDPLYLQAATPGWFNESNAAQEVVMRRATEFVTPFLMLTGGADPVVDPAAAREFYEASTAKDKQHKQYDGLLHEIFNEPERDMVFKDVVGWLDERAKGAARVAAGK